VTDRNYIVHGIDAETGSIVTCRAGDMPDQYVPCDGRELRRDQYPELFAILGTKYGPAPKKVPLLFAWLRRLFRRRDHILVDQESSMFNVPDMTGRRIGGDQ